MKQPVIGQTYFYIIAVVKGKRFLDGPYVTRDEASKMAWRNLQGVVWEIVESSSRDQSAVMRNTRHQVWSNTGDFEDAVSRMKHKV